MIIFRYIGGIITLTLALMLLASALAPHISPGYFWPLAFFGLAFPFLFVLNFLVMVVGLVMKKRRAFISLAALALTAVNAPRFIQFHAIEVPQAQKQTAINVVSFNTHFMGVFDFKGGDSSLFFNLLDSLSPDIICLQEFANPGKYYRKPMFRRFFAQYREMYNANADGYSNAFPGSSGVCIFSRFPIVNKGFLELENQTSNLTVFADVLFGNDTIRVVNTHLKSIVFDKEDYETVEKLKDPDQSPETSRLRRMLVKLKYAFRNRARQAEAVRGRINSGRHKVILCGDFNDSPTSYSYHTIRGELKDAFCESGIGMSRTYIGKMPSFRIDYILHSPDWKSYGYRTHTVNFSDHKMISCSIAIP